MYVENDCIQFIMFTSHCVIVDISKREKLFTLNIIYIARLYFIEPPSSGSLQNVSHGKLRFVFVQVVLLRGGRGGGWPGLPLVLETYRLDGDHPHHARPGAVR